MVSLIFNTVLRLNGASFQGFYRIVATPSARTYVWLAFVGHWNTPSNESEPPDPAGPVDRKLTQIARATLLQLEADGELAEVELDEPGRISREASLDDKDRALWQSRKAIAKPLLSHEVLCDALESTGGIGPLVREAMERTNCSRATVYRLWEVLCVRGFSVLSLMPHYDRCGAPGIARPVSEHRKRSGRKTLRQMLGEPEQFQQRGVTEDDRTKMIHHYRRLASPRDTPLGLYGRVIEATYVTRYIEGSDGRVPVMPAQGSFPNKRQYRHIIESETTKLERTFRKTTQGHFLRNLRGLKGPNYHGVPGPGHHYAIDSTIADVHLRSSVCRAWVVGRPIVYLVVDVWSTAIVGFYVCLSGPSWDTAKLALFSTFSDPRLSAELWGYTYVDVLTPNPTAPYILLCDRGEYLSAAARRTALLLNFNLSFNPAYRPDLKGLVEVLHRMTKDEQYRFLPGAINARRAELELKISAKESVMTTREYVHLLHGLFAHYNLFADRRHRLTTEMIAAGVQPSPAGLWRFGHESGLGFQARTAQEHLIGNLLHQADMSVRRDGIYVESLRYEGELATAERWTEQARNSGALQRTAYMFPGSASRIWTPNSDGMHQFNLMSTARAAPETTLDEWRDALIYSNKDQPDREYQRLSAVIANLATRADAVKRATESTREAEAKYIGPTLSTGEARELERRHGQHDERLSTNDVDPLQTDIPPTEEPTDYEAMMNAVFNAANAEGRFQ